MNTSPTALRSALWGVTVSIVVAPALAVALHRRRGSTTNTGGPHAAVPFRPGATYGSSSVTVASTEEGPYLDASLTFVVGATPLSSADRHAPPWRNSDTPPAQPD